jgi:hypothetical protein
VLELDTGSAETHIFAGSKLGGILSKRAGESERRGSVGGEYAARVVPHVEVHVGEVRREIPVLLIPGESPSDCHFDGMLGMDVLTTCRIALDQNGGVGRCPSAHTP